MHSELQVCIPWFQVGWWLEGVCISEEGRKEKPTQDDTCPQSGISDGESCKV